MHSNNSVQYINRLVYIKIQDPLVIAIYLKLRCNNNWFGVRWPELRAWILPLEQILFLSSASVSASLKWEECCWAFWALCWYKAAQGDHRWRGVNSGVDGILISEDSIPWIALFIYVSVLNFNIWKKTCTERRIYRVDWMAFRQFKILNYYIWFYLNS